MSNSGPPLSSSSKKPPSVVPLPSHGDGESIDEFKARLVLFQVTAGGIALPICPFKTIYARTSLPDGRYKDAKPEIPLELYGKEMKEDEFEEIVQQVRHMDAMRAQRKEDEERAREIGEREKTMAEIRHAFLMEQKAKEREREKQDREINERLRLVQLAMMGMRGGAVPKVQSGFGPASAGFSSDSTESDNVSAAPPAPAATTVGEQVQAKGSTSEEGEDKTKTGNEEAGNLGAPPDDQNMLPAPAKQELAASRGILLRKNSIDDIIDPNILPSNAVAAATSWQGPSSSSTTRGGGGRGGMGMTGRGGRGGRSGSSGYQQSGFGGASKFTDLRKMPIPEASEIPYIFSHNYDAPIVVPPHNLPDPTLITADVCDAVLAAQLAFQSLLYVTDVCATDSDIFRVIDVLGNDMRLRNVEGKVAFVYPNAPEGMNPLVDTRGGQVWINSPKEFDTATRVQRTPFSVIVVFAKTYAEGNSFLGNVKYNLSVLHHKPCVVLFMQRPSLQKRTQLAFHGVRTSLNGTARRMRGVGNYQRLHTASVARVFELCWDAIGQPAPYTAESAEPCSMSTCSDAVSAAEDDEEAGQSQMDETPVLTAGSAHGSVLGDPADIGTESVDGSAVGESSVVSGPTADVSTAEPIDQSCSTAASISQNGEGNGV